MRVRLRAAYHRRGGPTGQAGHTLDLDDTTAARLVAAGRAVALADTEPAPPPTPQRSRRKPAEDPFTNPDIPCTGNTNRI